MSRIAGLAVSERGAGAHVEQSVAAMLKAFESARPAVARTVAGGQGALGSWGWRGGQCIQRGPLLVALDGAIHNRRELGGGSLREQGDAAVFAELHERHGFVGALQRINGELAVAVHDTASGTLWLARDRFGTKPLYYSADSRRIAFGSQPRAVLALPGVSREVNRQFVALFAGSHYRTFDNDIDASPFRDVQQLPAGEALEWRDGKLTRSRYYELSEAAIGGDLAVSEAELVERYRGLLLDAVSLRLESAERPAFTLSGGMDSSSVLACAVERTGEKQQALSSVYRDTTYDESDDIQTILEATVSRWHRVPADDPDLATIVARMVAANDEPVATATWLSHYLLCQQAGRDGFGTLFGGLGGDELNAGEYEYFYFFFADLAAAGQEAKLAAETEKWVEYHDHPIFKKSPQAMRDGLARLVDLGQPGRCLPDLARLRRWNPAVRGDYFDLASFEPVMDRPFSSYLKNRTAQDIFRETAPCCLRAADRQTTAFGLDVSWPFFDHRLVELMFRVPGTLKIRAGVTKHLLREAMRGIVPESTRTRIKKTGWNAPAHQWFVGAGRDLVLDLCGSRSFRERGIYDVEVVRKLLDEHRDIVTESRPVDNHMMFLWQLVNVELWLRWNDTGGAVR